MAHFSRSWAMIFSLSCLVEFASADRSLSVGFFWRTSDCVNIGGISPKTNDNGMIPFGLEMSFIAFTERANGIWLLTFYFIFVISYTVSAMVHESVRKYQDWNDIQYRFPLL